MNASVTFVGHAEALLELGGTRLLTDPLRRRSLLGGLIRRTAPMPAAATAERLDAVLISHMHPDHLDASSLRSLPGRPLIVAPRGSGRFLRREGFARIAELGVGESLEVADARIVATYAEHNGRRWKIGRAVPALGYEIAAAERRVYFAGDTDLFDAMSAIGAPGIDLALLPIAGWGPRIGAGHLDPRRAAEAAARIKPRLVVPIHWGTLRRVDLLRRDPPALRDPIGEFVAALSGRAPSVEARVLPPGGWTDL